MHAVVIPRAAIPDDVCLDAKWNTACWYAVYTRSRHEKKVRDELVRRGIETFLPSCIVTRQWSDRRKQVEQPLFPGYAFVRFPLKERWDVLNTTGVVRLVGPSAARPIPVSENEIAALTCALREKVPLDPYPYLKEGHRVYVRSGPMKGIEGFIVRKQDHHRLVVSVDALMQSISLEVDQAAVEPA